MALPDLGDLIPDYGDEPQTDLPDLASLIDSSNYADYLPTGDWETVYDQNQANLGGGVYIPPDLAWMSEEDLWLTMMQSADPDITAEALDQISEQYPLPQDDWDYLKPPINDEGVALNSNNEPLPTGAESWDVNGNPYYGEGLVGLARRLYYKWTEPYELKEDAEVPDDLIVMKEQEFTSAIGTTTTSSALDWGATIDNIGDWLVASDYSVPWQALGRVVESLVDTAMTLFDIPWKKFEIAVGTAYATLGEVPAIEFEWAEDVKDTLAIPDDSFWVQMEEAGLAEETEFTDFRDLWDTVKQEWDPEFRWENIGIGTLAAPHFKLFEEKGYMDSSIVASRILYTTFIEPAKQEEFMRRYEAGEDPHLLMLELQNPWAELVGALFLDPLNLIGMWGRAAHTGFQVSNAVDDMRKVPDVITDVVKTLGKVADIDDPGKAYDLLNTTVDVVKAHTNTFVAHLDDIAGASGLSAHTADAKQFLVQQRASLFIQWVLGSITDAGKSSENAMETFRAIMQVHSGKEDEIIQGLQTIANFPNVVEPIFSKVGTEFGVIMNRLLGDAPPGKFMDDLLAAIKNGPEEMLEWWVGPGQGKLTKALKDFFPTVGERVEALKITKKLDAGKTIEDLKITEEVAEKVKNLAALGDISPITKSLLPIEQTLLRPVWKGFNTFFAGIYMGLSPGYAFRNLWSTMFHVGTDFGFAGITEMVTNLPALALPSWLGGKGLEPIHDSIRLLTGGILPDVGGFSKGTMGVQTLDKAKGLFKKLPFTAFADYVERWGASITVKAFVKKEMAKVLRPGVALPSYADMKAFGLGEDLAKVLVSKTIEFNGDIGKAAKWLTDSVGDEIVDLYKGLVWFTDDKELFMAADQYFEMDDFIKMLMPQEGDTAETIAARIDEAMDLMKRSVDEKNVADTPKIAENNIESISDAGAVSYVSKKTASDDFKKTHTISVHSSNANWKAETAMGEALDQAVKLIESKLGTLTDEQIAIFNNIKKSFDEFFGIEGYKVQRNDVIFPIKEKVASIYDNTIHYVEQYYAGTTSKVLQEGWDKVGLGGKAPAGSLYPSSLWQNMYKEKMAHYAVYRQTVQKIGNQLFDGLYQIDKTMDTRKILNANKLMGEAGSFDGMVVSIDTRMMFAIAERNADNALHARAMAKMLGMEAPVDEHILDAINKFSDIKYDNLREVPFNKADEALSAWVADKVTGAPDAAKVPEAVKTATVAQAQTVTPKYGTLNEALVPKHGEPQAILVKVGDEWYDVPFAPLDTTKDLQVVKHSARGQSQWLDPNVIDEVWDANGTLVYSKTGQSTSTQGVADYLARTTDTVKTATVADEAVDVAKLADEAVGAVDEAVRITAYDAQVGDIVTATFKKGDTKQGTIIAKLDDAANGSPRVRVRYEDGTTDVRQGIGINVTERPAKSPFVSENMLADLGKYEDELMKLGTPPNAGQTPMPHQPIQEALPALDEWADAMKAAIKDNFGTSKAVIKDKKVMKAIAKIEKDAIPKIGEARLTVARGADYARDFTMLSYPNRRNLDLAFAYAFPYQFWYTRTYARWFQRLMYSPDVIAGYVKYKNHMEQLHAGMPEWWKYNINTNDLPGMDSENPLFFNLEQTINPLQGILGVDFNDPAKRKDWYTKLLDYMGRFGPSPFTPLSWVAAMDMYFKGEEEAAVRWLGRLLPQTTHIKNAMALLNIKIPTLGGINEFDPFVLFSSDGMDVWERRRVGRMLGAMVDSGTDPRLALEAARTQEGQLWEDATWEAQKYRAGNWGVFAGSQLGIGLKARNATDMQIDQFYNDMYKLMNMKDNYSAEEYKDLWGKLKEDYPFADVVLLAKNYDQEQRDTSYAYNVLGRIPPGQKDDLIEAFYGEGAYDYISKFYDSKGDWEDWEETDRDRFMAFIVDLGAKLDLPDDATKQEWDQAKDAWGWVRNEMEERFGEWIHNRIDGYYQLETQEEKQAYLEANPSVEQAMSFREAHYVNNPVLQPYYASIDKIEKYWQGLVYDVLAEELGEDVWDKWDEYNRLKMVDEINMPDWYTYFEQQTGLPYDAMKSVWEQYYSYDEKSKERRQMWDDEPLLQKYVDLKEEWEELDENYIKAAKLYWDEHPELKQYMEMKDELWEQAADAIIKVGEGLKAPAMPPLVPGEDVSIGLQQAMDAIQNPQEMPQYYQNTEQQWLEAFAQMSPPEMIPLLMDTFVGGEQMPPVAEDELERIAEEMGLPDVSLLIALLQRAFAQ